VAVPNLTRSDAERRAGLLDVQSYAVSLDLTDGAGKPGEGTFRSRTTVRFTCREPGAATFVDLVAATVGHAVLNGSELDVSDYLEEKGIALPELAEHNELVVEAGCRYMNTGEGLHRFVDPVDGQVYLYSQFETADAKRMFACFDQPDLKASFSMTVTAPAGWVVVSNELAEQVEDVPGGPGQCRVVRHVFAPTKPMSTYLVALVAGPYAAWHDEYRQDGTASLVIPLGIY